MISIYKASTIAIVAAISASMILSVGSIAATPQAQVQTPAISAEVAGSTIAQGEVNRSEARKIVNAYLKEKGKRNLRAGRTHADGEYWVVSISSPMGVDAGAMRVHQVSGELSKA